MRWTMSQALRRTLISACIAIAAPQVLAAEVKVGVIASFTGPYAIWGKQFQEAVDLYLEQQKGKAGNHDVKILYRDVGGPNGQRARQLAQELIVRDGVAVLAGLEFTPTALAVADVVTEAKIPFVIFNAGTSMVVQKSPFFVRTGFTQWSVSIPVTKWATQQGYKSCAIVAADYGPGHDAIDAYRKGFGEAGGKIAAEIRVPVGTTDFSSYLQRVRDASPQCTFMFMPVGPMSAGFIKSYGERGLSKIQLITGAETQEFDLPAIGDSAIGVVTALHYGPYLDNPANKAFVQAYKAKYGKDALPSLISIAAYDGMKVVFEMIKATDGKRDGVKAIEAVKGLKWDSPRGPVQIDPRTRDIVQNIYVRRVEKMNGVLMNKAFYTYPAVKDPWLEANP
ncbi:MAG TPA: ABC transporter substrate-binding protein [Burkholderiales bacterium]|nr:ABC transporter substrate-binding protein [Burkholderiales bacterium]